jgi:hypothetical protein
MGDAQRDGCTNVADEVFHDRGAGGVLALLVLAMTLVHPFVSWAQEGSEPPQADAPAPTTAQEQGDTDQQKRIWGFIPNYRTSPTLEHYQPLTARAKWSLTLDDALDRGTFMTAAGLAGVAQWKEQTPQFGHGFPAYARYFAASTVDLMVGDVMTEGLYPVLLHEDPRYFRSGTGHAMTRIGSAMSQIFWTHTDSGRSRFNFSEVVGNSTAVALSDAYYPGSHSLANSLTKLGLQLALDTASNIIKEFSPDLNRAVTRRRQSKSALHDK